MTFPDDFAWGAAAAAYQIEGAARDDGRGVSIWDTFCQRPGAVYNGHNGDHACDHYRRYSEDVELMQRIGLKAFRLSLSWTRILPDGCGRINEAGLDFYDRLIDACLAAGITPYVTLFHWDFPQALYERGGWLNRDCAEWFAAFAATAVQRLSDRVRYWITINEPQVFLSHGHKDGVHAPGDHLSMKEVLQAGHHVLLAHGKAVQAIRETSSSTCQVGYAPMGLVKMPASASPEDIEAARASTFEVAGSHLFNNAWWMDPVLLGGYPQAGLEAYGGNGPQVRSGDFDLIHQPLDFLGINTYSGECVRAAADGLPEHVPWDPGYRMTTFRWPVAPTALYWGPRFLHERYRVPIYITENGMANTDWVTLDGRVHDPQRIDFIQRYLRQLRKAVQDGVDVRGYFYWSILDNFEWAEGYKERFGLIYVDYQTQARTLKDSAYWYAAVIASKGANLDTPYTYPLPIVGQPKDRDNTATVGEDTLTTA